MITRKNEELFEKALEAARNLHADTSVSMKETVKQLQSLIDEIDMLMEATESDIKRKEKE